jgi:hypothetical protein
MTHYNISIWPSRRKWSLRCFKPFNDVVIFLIAIIYLFIIFWMRIRDALMQDQESLFSMDYWIPRQAHFTDKCDPAQNILDRTGPVVWSGGYKRVGAWPHGNQICCRAARCGAARGPFDHFEIRANSNLKVLTRISKWSNGLRAAPHRAARQWIRVRPHVDIARIGRLLFYAVGLDWHLILDRGHLSLQLETWNPTKREAPFWSFWTKTPQESASWPLIFRRRHVA